MYRYLTVGALIIVALSSCSEKSGGASQNSESQVEGVADQNGSMVEPNSPWTRVIAKDPMTDETVMTVSAKTTVGSFKVETEITCRNAKISYQFATFNSDDTPAPLARRVQGFEVVSTIQMRADANPPKSLTLEQSRYSNVFLLTSEDFPAPWISSAADAGKASLVTVKLQLQQGDVTFQFDQKDTLVQSVLTPCARKIAELENAYNEQTALAAERTAAAEREAQELAEANEAEKLEQNRLTEIEDCERTEKMRIESYEYNLRSTERRSANEAALWRSKLDEAKRSLLVCSQT
jgi:hypothetical protein